MQVRSAPRLAPRSAATVALAARICQRSRPAQTPSTSHPRVAPMGPQGPPVPSASLSVDRAALRGRVPPMDYRDNPSCSPKRFPPPNMRGFRPPSTLWLEHIEPCAKSMCRAISRNSNISSTADTILPPSSSFFGGSPTDPKSTTRRLSRVQVFSVAAERTEPDFMPVRGRAARPCRVGVRRRCSSSRPAGRSGVATAASPQAAARRRARPRSDNPSAARAR